MVGMVLAVVILVGMVMVLAVVILLGMVMVFVYRFC